MKKSEEFRFKIVIVGDGAVGKTSLIKKFTKGTFERDYVKTIGAQFSKYNKEINGDLVRLLFWDIAGQDDFNFLHHLFYKESRAAIIVYSLEENELGKNSFTHIKNWHEAIEQHCSNIPVVLFANKIDLVDEENLDATKIQKLVDDNNFLKYFITSAKTGQGVIEAFNAIIEHLYLRFKIL
ncbi:MAG: GTP-binding protein [Promethearchaeota archaeon]|nr:MAG: GTP-binding protein [Candidatus Lokiarchaeota archaeon]